MAAIALISGDLFGIAIENWGVRTIRLTLTESEDSVLVLHDAQGYNDFDARETAHPEEGTTDPISLHFGFVAVAIAIGWLLVQALTAFERATWVVDGEFELLK